MILNYWKKKYYSDENHDHHFHFTQEMMEKLHSDGELEIVVQEDEQEMVILFTYNPEEDIKEDFENLFKEFINKAKKWH